jgi:YD repeat-containing protein
LYSKYATASFDLASNRTQMLNTTSASTETTAYEYDANVRLVFDPTDTDYDTIARYGFDLASNRVQLTKDLQNAILANFTADETTVYDYDENDRLRREELTTSGSATTTFYEYGTNFNSTEQTKQTVYNGSYQTDPETGATKTTTYEYNVQGRLETVTIDDGTTTTVTSYKYNDDGVRVEQSVSTNGAADVVTTYHIDPQNHTGYAKAIEEIVDGTLARSYAIGHMILSQASSAGTVLQLLHDGHGSTRALVDALGAVIERYAYEAYGATLVGVGLTPASTALTTWLFANDGQYDANSALTYHIKRWRQGARFMTDDDYTGDKFDPISLHKYLYTHGNPVMGIDPSGQMTLTSILASFAIVSVPAILLSPNVANAPSVGDATYPDRSGDLALSAMVSIGLAPPLVVAGQIVSPMVSKILHWRGPKTVVIPTQTSNVVIAGRQVGGATFINPGPLSERAAATFSGARYTIVDTAEDVILYRAWGADAAEFGGFWSTLPPRGSLAAKMDSALLPKWGNSATEWTAIRVPAGNRLYVGEVGTQGGIYVGGTPQVLVEGGAQSAWKTAQGALK